MRTLTRSLLCALAMVTLLGAGCENPNGQGLQEFGSITGRLLDDQTGQPVTVSQTYVSVGSVVVTSVDAKGGFTLGKVPVGKQTVNINALTYQTMSIDVNVVKDQTSDVGYIRLKSTLAQ